MVKKTVKCATCGAELDSIRAGDPCPSCQSEHQLVEIATTDTLALSLKGLLGVSWKTAGKVYRRKQGDSLYRKTGEWNFIRQVVDEAHDAISEHLGLAQSVPGGNLLIVVPETGIEPVRALRPTGF